MVIRRDDRPSCGRHVAIVGSKADTPRLQVKNRAGHLEAERGGDCFPSCVQEYYHWSQIETLLDESIGELRQ